MATKELTCHRFLEKVEFQCSVWPMYVHDYRDFQLICHLEQSSEMGEWA